eukprot:PhF_6_TR17369/c0_g1_i1/m.26595
MNPFANVSYTTVAIAVPAAILLVRLVTNVLRKSPDELGAVDKDLHSLRDEGARKFCSHVVKELRSQAARGRSDYDFFFRRYDLWLEWVWLGLVVPVPVLRSYWDCIDSDGSRAVVKELLQGGGTGLRVEWCIHSLYPKGWFTPKWVLTCRWDKLELRQNVIGGR